MSDTVIIMGAGASYDAGIPLMAGFVERMWEFAVRKQVDGEWLSPEDLNTFQKAIDIRNELDSYHGRATFDDRNLEDIISILTFDEIQRSNRSRSKSRLFWFTKAISRTIELTCKVKHDGKNRKQEVGYVSEYSSFWAKLFYRLKSGKKWPTVISLNYDLVLERSLFHTLIGTNLLPLDNVPGVEIKYYYDAAGDFQYRIKSNEFLTGDGFKTEMGTGLVEAAVPNSVKIEILKLHGSLNFPRTKPKESVSLVHPVDDPFILPPMINKMSSTKPITKMWATAIQRLRTAKNVIIVGYSLPQTDIYMQYFLKAALGPNLNLNRIYVFDPVLFRDDETSEEMMGRYGNCFSPQLQKRIVFKPGYQRKVYSGAFHHFVEVLDSILF
ncbi:MAG: hypothetical protein ISS79_01955 [Phycisphaerae bacterium]|nr:hypothetical protein [Phycisphaerae bacterium]